MGVPSEVNARLHFSPVCAKVIPEAQKRKQMNKRVKTYRTLIAITTLLRKNSFGEAERSRLIASLPSVSSEPRHWYSDDKNMCPKKRSRHRNRSYARLHLVHHHGERR